MGRHSSPKGPAAGLLSSRCLQMWWKEEGICRVVFSMGHSAFIYILHSVLTSGFNHDTVCNCRKSREFITRPK